MPANTVVVSRPSRWGNMVRIGQPLFVDPVDGSTTTREATRAEAVSLYRIGLKIALTKSPDARAALGQLRGKNLACWCRLDQPCHADTLLELANAPMKCDVPDA